MTDIFRPMLATDADLDKLRFPLLASAKLDGVRAVVRDGVVFSRSNKPIPNAYVQKLFNKHTHFDGELIVGDPTSKACYRDTVSGVMSVDGEPDVKLYVFDHVGEPSHIYNFRAERLTESKHVVVHEQVMCLTLEDILKYEEQCLDAGYEGLILRDPNAPYKQGRSTVKEGYLLKLKRFVDDEATVIGFEERMHNGNVAIKNELGRTARSSHKENKSGRGDLGALLLRHSSGIEFSCGTGFTDGERGEIWANRDRYLGQLAKYKHFPVGAKDLPRHPVFLGWRDRRDL